MSKWSVSIKAEGDRPMKLEEIVALADAVAPLDGVASGVGAMSYGAQIVVEATVPMKRSTWRSLCSPMRS